MFAGWDELSLRCRCSFAVFAALLLSAAPWMWAQAAEPAVPLVVQYAGTLAGRSSHTVGIIFSLYKEQSGGAPLWQEVRNVTVDATGHYAAQIGSASAAGVPMELFRTGEARWLGVQTEGEPKQPRVLLTTTAPAGWRWPESTPPPTALPSAFTAA
jgi:hypothetical protein